MGLIQTTTSTLFQAACQQKAMLAAHPSAWCLSVQLTKRNAPSRVTVRGRLSPIVAKAQRKQRRNRSAE